MTYVCYFLQTECQTLLVLISKEKELIVKDRQKNNKVRCSLFSKQVGEKVSGSAPNWKRCLVFELPSPWKADILETPHFPPQIIEIVSKVESAGEDLRIQCVNPDDEYSVTGFIRVMLFSRPEKQRFDKFIREEYLIPTELLGGLVESLVLSRDDLKRYKDYLEKNDDIRDIFVCTHGIRDTCCGSFGIPIYRQLRERYPNIVDHGLRIWRMSHIGGHRLAPNLIDMPSGRNWVRIEESDLDTMIFRNKPVSQLAEKYRGLIALDSPYEMVAEGEVFIREGWRFLDMSISSKIESATDVDGVKVSVEALSAINEPVTYFVVVKHGGKIEYIKCRGDEVEEDDQYHTVSVEKIV